MKQFSFSLTLIILLFSLIGSAQSHKCATMHHLEKRFLADPTLKQRMLLNEKQTKEWIADINVNNRQNLGVVTIPVVVHVIWKKSIENISNSQIQSQIDVLNKDFRFLNTDKLIRTHPFYNKCADAQIEFCLAATDPNGNPTTGITRTRTNIDVWDDDNSDFIKSTENGGLNNWDPTQYLNLYVANLDEETLGFATFPDELASAPELDGVVIRSEAFGTSGTAGTGYYSYNDGGRTTTHEVGHWLNLRHIWGDTICGDDFVFDTEVAEEENYECPKFPHRPNNACGSSANGEMYMNYMDYVDDSCMNLFTIGQSERMSATLNGIRSGLLSSKGSCQRLNSNIDIAFSNSIFIYPNPNNGSFNIEIPEISGSHVTATVVNLLGEALKEVRLYSSNTVVDCSKLVAGVFFIKINEQNKTVTKKIFIVR